MRRRTVIQVDNRDAEQMYEYLESRIDVLKRRIVELETENEFLRHMRERDVRESMLMSDPSHSQFTLPAA